MKHSNRSGRLNSSATLMLWLLPALLIVPNVALAITEGYAILSSISGILLPLGVYCMLSGLSRNIGRTVLLSLPFIFFAAFQIVLLYLYGESIIAIDMYLNIVTTNVSEATELLGNMVTAIIAVSLLYATPLIWAVILVVKKARANVLPMILYRRLGAALTVIGIAGVAASYIFVPHYALTRELFPVNVINNMFSAVSRASQSQHYHETSASFSHDAVSLRPDSLREIYVLMIGETSRTCNWQLAGYDRPTNPRLSSRCNLLFYPKTLTESNITHKSVPLLLSHLTSDNFGDSIASTKSMLSAFRQAGYYTAYISNHDHNHSYIDYFADEADTTLFINDDLPQHHRDMDMIPYLRRVVTSKADKIFVILHCYGSHFNYKERYPVEYARWLPDDAGDAIAINRSKLVNAYDNTILYTDAVIDSVISTVDNVSPATLSAVVYVSDHGEDIFDDRRERFLHASPTPTYYQLHVPALIWMSDGYVGHFPDKYSAAKNHIDCEVASSRMLFDTMMSISGVVTRYNNPVNSLTDTNYCEPARKYLNDYNEYVPLRRSGMSKLDIEQLDKKHISTK